MRTLGNIIWFIFGGLIDAILYFLSGILFCITLIFIPIGIKCFKMAGLVILPFKKTVEGNFEEHPIKNALWLMFGGLGSWFYHSLIGVLLCITIIGIPFGKQNFKIAKYALRPFGATIEKM